MHGYSAPGHVYIEEERTFRVEAVLREENGYLSRHEMNMIQVETAAVPVNIGIDD